MHQALFSTLSDRTCAVNAYTLAAWGGLLLTEELDPMSYNIKQVREGLSYEN